MVGTARVAAAKARAVAMVDCMLVSWGGRYIRRKD